MAIAPPGTVASGMRFEPDHHFRIPTEVRASTIEGAGQGVFSRAPVPAGRFVGMDFPKSKWLVPREALDELPVEHRKYAWRHVEEVYFATEGDVPLSPADHLNHSFEPNLLLHVGCYFTLRDIAAGDELFVDYRYLRGPTNGPLRDNTTGRLIEGFPWREALRRSCRSLLALLDADEDASGR